MVLILFNLVFLIMKNMSNIKRQLRDLENTSFGPVTDKHYSISESNVKSRHNSISNISPSLSNAKLFPDKKYSFITFKTEKMKNEIEEIKKQFLSYNTPQDQNSSISKAKTTKCTLLNDSYDNNDIPYYIKYATDAICWSQAPERLRDLCKQRKRWHLGLFQSMWKHKIMLFNPKFGAVSIISYFYFLIYFRRFNFSL